MLIGVLLMGLSFFGGAVLNLSAGLLATALGAGVIVGVRRYERRVDGA